MKLLKENVGLNLCDLELGNAFLEITLKVQVTKEKIVTWTSSKLKTFVLQRTPSRN